MDLKGRSAVDSCNATTVSNNILELELFSR